MLTKEENLKCLAQCVYLGMLVVDGNVNRAVYENMNRVAEEIYRRYIASKGQAASPEQVTDRQIADLHDRLYDETNSIFEDFKSYAALEKINCILSSAQ